MLIRIAKTSLVIVLGLSLTSAFFLRNPAERDRAFLVLNRFWEIRWPFETGRGAVQSVMPLIERVGLIGPTRVEVEPGINIGLNPHDLIAQYLLQTGVWEPDTWEIIDSHLPSDGTFIDVGAHIGYFSLKAAKKVGPGGRVVSIEPNPRTLIELNENLRQSGAKQAVVQPVACADRRTRLDLFLGPESNTGTASLARQNAARDPGQQVESVTVDAVPLDEILEGLNLSHVHVIKMDIEGAELIALRGAVKTLARYRPVLVLELIEEQLHNMGASEAELVAFLNKAGYVRSQTADLNVAWLPAEAQQARK
jgi:FkbM family methyltransferase